MKKLYLISQEVNNGYDTYDSAVVCAESEQLARLTHPRNKKDWDGKDESWSSWCNAKDVKVELIGNAIKDLEVGVVCSSFNEG